MLLHQLSKIEMKKIFLILGNQLFNPDFLSKYKKDHIFYMAEDYGLCSYEKHHKHKIIFFLSCMRSFRDELKKKGFKIIYKTIDENDFKFEYTKKLKEEMMKREIKEISAFEIEDKVFEERILNFCKDIKLNYINSPQFLTKRDEFKKYLLTVKKPFMASFYKTQRIKYKILVDEQNKPIGDKWSFDNENRKKMPKNVDIPKKFIFYETKHTKDLKGIVNELFRENPGNVEDFWIGTRREDSIKFFEYFLKFKFNLFGDYEDAVDQRDNILFHSALSPFINIGLITPAEILSKLRELKVKVNINSYEGYVRQIIGWREFIRGIYREYSDEFEEKNFFNHNRKMKNTWYDGTTGIPPLDHSIKNAIKYGWTHHIERLMILSNIMNLAGIHPKDIYKWFMEMFIDSSEWVMVPNVYGMGLFSDGGIFATKPYICGSAYFLKMMDFKKGEWCEVMDGLYWNFIDRNRDFFLKNPRLSMMVRVLDKMKDDRKKRIFDSANKFIDENTIS